jgi:hypothetical protein
MEISKKDYVRRILEAYRTTPGTSGVIRRNDRLLAANLYDRGIEPLIVENALVLAAARRLFRSPNAPPLQPIRSLHYLIPVIDEVRRLFVSQDYFRYLRFRIHQKQRNSPS